MLHPIQDAAFNSNVHVASSFLNLALQTFMDEMRNNNFSKKRQLLVTTKCAALVRLRR